MELRFDGQRSLILSSSVSSVLEFVNNLFPDSQEIVKITAMP